MIRNAFARSLRASRMKRFNPSRDDQEPELDQVERGRAGWFQSLQG